MSHLIDPVAFTLKSAAAAALAIVVLQAVGAHDALSAGFVALVCVSPSANAGLRRGLEQLAGSLVGGLIAGLLQLAWPGATGSPWALLIALLLANGLCFTLRLQAYFVAGFTVIYFLFVPFHSPTEALTVRMVALLIGIASATLVNVVVSSAFSRRITERRIRRARQLVAAPIRAIARSLEAGETIDTQALGPAFSAIAELRDDLGATARERFVLRASDARAAALRGLAVADALEEAAHLVKEITLISRASERDDRVGEPLRALADALLAESPLTDPLTNLRVDAPGEGFAAIASGMRDAALARSVARLDGPIAQLRSSSP